MEAGAAAGCLGSGCGPGPGPGPGPEPGPGPGPEDLNVSAGNCLELLARARRCGQVRVQERVLRFMSDNYLHVLQSPVFGRLSAPDRDRILARRTEGVPVLAVAESAEAVERGGPGEDGPPRRVLCLDQDRWEEMTRIPEEVPAAGSGMCTLFNYLFVAGGLWGDRPSALVFCFNPLTGGWSRLRSLREPRCQLRLVALDGFLYAVGGECLFSVERYDPRADRWAPVAPLPRGSLAVAHEAVACGGQLFVSGGSLCYRLIRYDPTRDEWEECPCADSRRRPTDMVALGGLMYRFYVDRDRALVSLNRYSTVVKAWLGAAPLPLRDPLPFRCAVLQDRIICLNRSQVLVLEQDGDQHQLRPHAPPPPSHRGTLVPLVLHLNSDGLDPGQTETT